MHWVRGNGEREVAEASAAGARAGRPGRVTAALSAAELGTSGEALGELPLTVELDGVLYCHAEPAPRRRDAHPALDGGALGGGARGRPAGLVVAGHTHQQDDRAVGDVRFVNAGSVGLPYEGDGAARWLWVADGEPELRQTEYDAARRGARILDAGWPDERSVGGALTDPVEPLVVTRIFEDLARSG